MDSPDLATNDQQGLEGAPSGVGVPLEEGIPIGCPSVDEIGEGSTLGVAAAPLLPPRPANTVLRRRRPPDQFLLSTYIPPYERIHLPADMGALDLEGAREIIHHWSPFNQAEPPVAHMCDLYSNYF